MENIGTDCGLAVGFGERMKDAFMFVIYTNSNRKSTSTDLRWRGEAQLIPMKTLPSVQESLMGTRSLLSTGTKRCASKVAAPPEMTDTSRDGNASTVVIGKEAALTSLTRGKK